MVKYIVPFLIIGSAIAEETPPHGKMVKPLPPVLQEKVLTREEINSTSNDGNYFPINDIISERTVFVHMTAARKAFMQSMNYYNRALFQAVKKATIIARDENKRMHVNIVAGPNTPAHAFKGRNNVYTTSEYSNGQYTIFAISPDGDLSSDHYEHGQYGQLGRDGVSFQHAIKTFKAIDIRDAIERAKKVDKEFNWVVEVKRPDTATQVTSFDTYLEYESWLNRYRYPASWYKVQKVNMNKSNMPKVELTSYNNE
tara:strand:- start:1114 stop:1878 length:765 start_codon:yes stop_codon:yes gene_type:complete